MRGETVYVEDVLETGADPFGNPLFERFERAVDNVLVAPGDTEDVIESNRPDGAEVRYTCYFPKTFDEVLENRRVKVRGEWLDVIGSPDHFDKLNCPTDWWEVVKVGGVHG